MENLVSQYVAIYNEKVLQISKMYRCRGLTRVVLLELNQRVRKLKLLVFMLLK